MMRDMDIGAPPVAEDDRLVGMITDGDIAVRAVADDKPSSTPVREVMTEDLKYCFDDDVLDQVARNMAGEQVRRLVVDRNNKLVEILSVGDLATQGGQQPATQALEGISQPGGQHATGRS
jgi:CBS domain-containing protein